MFLSSMNFSDQPTRTALTTAASLRQRLHGVVIGERVIVAGGGLHCHNVCTYAGSGQSGAPS
jgi:hypothetical protein